MFCLKILFKYIPFCIPYALIFLFFYFNAYILFSSCFQCLHSVDARKYLVKFSNSEEGRGVQNCLKKCYVIYR